MFRGFVLCLIAVCLVFSGFGQSLTVPSSHPRLWWTPARIQQAKQWYSTHPFNPPSDGTGAGEYTARATKYVLTGNASDCSTAVNWAATYVPSDWNNSLNSDQVRWNGEAVALVYDWCYPVMTASQRSTIISNWNQYISFNMNNTAWGYTNMPANNYFWGNIRNAFEWGVATYGDNSSAQSFIDHALNTRWPAFKTYSGASGKGGVFQEGSGYGMYMARYFAIPIVSSGYLGRNLAAETNFYREAAYNMIYQTTPAPTPSAVNPSGYYQVLAFNDDQFSDATDTDNNFPDLMGAARELYATVPTGQYIQQWMNMTGNTGDYFIQATAPSITPLSFSNLPLDYFAPGPGYLYSRTNWTGTTTYVQIQGGEATGVGHEHMDMGNFHIWRNGYWLSKESTGYSDSITNWGGSGTTDISQAPAHNVMFYNGGGYSYAYRQGNPTIVRMETNPRYAYIATDVSQALRSSDTRFDNPSAGTTVRELLFIKPLETLVVLDRMLSGSASDRKGIAVHFENSPSVSGTKFVGVNGSQALEVNSVLPASPTVRVVNEGSAKGARYRLELETSGTAQVYFLTVLQARNSSGASLTINATQDSASITLNLQHPTLGNATVVFLKGSTSTGGQFGYAASGTPTLAALLTSVQGISVTDQGPAWAGVTVTPPPPPPTTSACDLNGDGLVNSLDYNAALNQALGLAACSNGDLDKNGKCDVVDVQRIANAVAGGACRVGP